MQILKQVLFCVVLWTIAFHSLAQRIDDSLLNKVARRFEESQHLSLEQIVKPTSSTAGKMRETALPCYSGKQVTIVAIFNKKPVAAYGRMLVKKHYSTSTKFDEHLFQQAAYDKNFKVHYALLSVYFPTNATYKNCDTELQVYDKKQYSNKVWLIVLTK